ncbi:FecR family protein [Fibrella sp. WM1]|uniref:FecR family protein n=1 Tax=Fibrella musci TaxID=3242485 RepID=UPI003521AD04
MIILSPFFALPYRSRYKWCLTMDKYKDYIAEDFLLDDDFLDWAKAGYPQSGTVWNDFLLAHPEKKDDVNQAKAFIEYQRTGANLPDLSDADLKQHIGKILARTNVDQTPVRRLINVSTWWRVAAAITLLIGLGWRIFYWKPTPAFAYEKLVKASAAPLTEIVNTNQPAKSVTLPDGSHITLTRNARISYSTQMAKEPSRSVYLSGEAFFEVTKDPNHPFFVYADGLVTRVVGTSFTIKTTEKQVSVVVRSGQVAVYAMKEEGAVEQAEEKLMLTPNQQATFVADENQLTRTIASQPVSLSMADQVTTQRFDNTHIADVFAQLEQTYGIPIQYDAVKMKNCFLTSTLTNESFYSKLAIICQTIGASYRVQGTQVVIESTGCE